MGMEVAMSAFALGLALGVMLGVLLWAVVLPVLARTPRDRG